MFMTDSLSYRSAGGISQGDTELPDSLAMDVSSSGNGYGSFAAGSRSLIGIGNTTALGYVHSVHEEDKGWRSVCSEGKNEVELVYFTTLIFHRICGLILKIIIRKYFLYLTIIKTQYFLH